jgi:bifunctional DNA-binding transcriptional regulator/antitoxin component of YhaV-PrlF toxin-antitoxin module
VKMKPQAIDTTMTVTVKNRTPLVVPPAVRRRAGLKSGQELEFKVSGGVITILPKLPTADAEYTPEQRRIVNAKLAGGLADIKAGRIHGPFSSTAEMIAHIEARLKKRAPAKRAKRAR